MFEVIFVTGLGFVSGYMVCSILKNRDNKDKKIPFKEDMR